MNGERISALGWFFFRRTRYPDEYVWLVFVSALDLMFTWIILLPPRDGNEVNLLPNWIISRFGLPGVTVYKFALVSLVIVICEVVGRTRLPLGRAVARIGIALTGAVVVWSLAILFLDAMRRGG